MCQSLETKIIEYIKVIKALDRNFKFEQHIPNSVALPLVWKDSFNPQSAI